jgi:hypothetical protein
MSAKLFSEHISGDFDECSKFGLMASCRGEVEIEALLTWAEVPQNLQQRAALDISAHHQIGAVGKPKAVPC